MNGGRIRMSFEDWMKEVDERVKRKTGLSVHDLPDCPFHDWYDDKMHSMSAANRAIKAAKEE